MSCGQLALHQSGVPIGRYYASEVDKFAIKVTQANWPNTIQLGDVEKVTAPVLPKIDLLIGGSPCQGFSFAGKRLNFDDPRSQLFFEYVRLLQQLKPTYFLLENVAMAKKSEDVITEFMGVDPVTINSNLVSAQNRKRLYWTNIPFEFSGDYYEHIFADILLRDPPERLILSPGELDYMNRPVSTKVASKHGKPRWEYSTHNDSSDLKSHAVVANYSKGVPFNILFDGRFEDPPVIRKLDPIECERLQTVPDNYTNHTSYKQRYKMLGNGWTVSVIEQIFLGLL